MDDTFRRGPLLLVSGRSNLPLAEEIGQRLGSTMDTATIHEFSDGELFVRIDKNARGRDVIIIQPTNSPAGNMMELLLLADAAKRASAARVTAVVPYFGYGRQDRKDQPRVAIGAKLMANLMVAAGVDRVVSIDFHQHQIQGFFDIPVDHLYAAPVFTKYFREKGLKDLVVVAPRSFRACTAFAIVPPVSIMSSVRMHTFPSTSPTTLITSDEFGAGRRLSMIAKVAPSRLE